MTDKIEKKADKVEKKTEGPFRKHDGILGIIERVLLILIPVVGLVAIFNLFLYIGVGLWKEQYLALLLALVTAVIMLIVPLRKKSPRDKLPWYDIIFSLVGFCVWLYIAIDYQSLALDIGLITPMKVVIGLAAILVILECVRRFVGWPIAIVIFVFILYALFANLVPGPLQGRAIPWDRLITHLYIDSGSLMGTALKITATVVLAFILFGQFLFTTGGGKVLTDFAMLLIGKYRGGPAKVAIIGSSLFGMMSGNAAANVATVGVVTIPMMKQTGYSAEYAAAVESTSSTGGQIMPPVMGAAAFLMAQFLGIPYATVALAAMLPAILYYVGVFTQVDLQAGSKGLKGVPREMLPSWKKTLIDGIPFVVPVLVLVYTLFILRMQPEAAAICAVVATALVTLFKKASRLNLKKLVVIFEGTGRGVLEIIVIAAAVGVVIGVTSITGLAFAFTSALVQLAGGNIIILLLLAAAGAIVLGMGATVTAVYLFVVILIAPAIVQLGIPPLAAHMYVFYFACASFLTPPVCMAVYTAAPIANAEPMKTAWQAMRLAIAAFVVPFAFVFDPALLLIGSPIAIIIVFISALLGVICISIASEAYLFGKINWLKRIIFVLAGISLLTPFWVARLGGAIVMLLLVFIEWRLSRQPVPVMAVEKQ